MKIIKTISINDEPYVAQSTGVRTAKVTYTGPRYVYFEVSKSHKKIMAHVESSDSPDIQTAMEKCNLGDEDLICVELDMTNDEQFLVGCSMLNHILEIEDYSEVLPNGEKYEEKYNTTDQLGSFINFSHMNFDHEAKSFDSVKFFVKPDQEESTFIENVQLLIDKVESALENNSYEEEVLQKITTYKNELIQFQNDYDGSIKYWKLKFPVCTVAY